MRPTAIREQGLQQGLTISTEDLFGRHQIGPERRQEVGRGDRKEQTGGRGQKAGNRKEEAGPDGK